MKSVKSVTYGAMSVGLISLLFLLDRIFIGNLGFLMSLVIPVPLILYGIKFSFKESVVVYFTMLVASLIFNGMPPAMMSMVGFGLIGLIYIYAHEQEYSPMKRNVLLFLCMSVIYIVMMKFFSAYFGLSVKESVDAFLDVAPQLSMFWIYTSVVLSTGLTVLMEVYIITTSVKLLVRRLDKHLRK